MQFFRPSLWIMLCAAIGCGGGGGGSDRPASFLVNVDISGLQANQTVQISLNGGQSTTVGANGRLSFATRIASGASYAVAIATQPSTQTCIVTAGQGVVSNADVIGPSIECVGYRIAGSISGLRNTGVLELGLNGAQLLTSAQDGQFEFPETLPNNENYVVDVISSPPKTSCGVINGSGQISSNDVSNIQVTCRLPEDGLPFSADNSRQAINAPLQLYVAQQRLSAIAQLGLQQIFANGSFQEDCSGGSGALAHDDRDGSGSLSPGDTVIGTFTNCSLFDIGQVSGTLTLDISGIMVSRNADAVFQATVRLQGFTLNDYLYTGAFVLDASTSQNAHRTAVTQIDPFTRDVNGFIDTLTNYEWSYSIDDRDYQFNAMLGITSELLIGTYECMTDVAGDTRFIQPATGGLTCTSVAPSQLRVTEGTDVGVLEVDPTDSGTFELVTDSFSWAGAAESSAIVAAPMHFFFRNNPFRRSLDPIANASIAVTDFATSATTGRIYVANASGIVAMNTTDLSVVGNLALPGNPSVLTLSADGLTLYVGYEDRSEVQRVSVNPLTLGPAFSLGNTTSGDPLFAIDIAVLPGNSTNVAVATDSKRFSTVDGHVAVFDDGVPRPTVLSDPGVTDLLVLANGTLLGYEGSLSSHELSELRLDSAGVSAGAVWDPGLQLFGLELFELTPGIVSGGRLVVDFANGLIRGRHDLNDAGLNGSASAATYSATTDRVYNITQDTIAVFDPNEHTPVGAYATNFTSVPRNASIVQNQLIAASDDEVFVFATADLADTDDQPCVEFDFSTFDASNIRAVDCPISDFVYDESRDLVYAAVAASAGVNGNSIAIIEPDSGSIARYVFVGSNPGAITLTPNRDRLLVTLQHSNRVAELDLATETVTYVGPLADTASPQRTISAIDFPTTGLDLGLAVSRRMDLSNPDRTYLVASGTATESNPPQFPAAANLLFAPGRDDLAFGLASNRLFTYDVTPTTVNQTAQTDNLLTGQSMIRRGNFFYTGAGQKFDPASLSVPITYNLIRPTALDVDLTAGHLYVNDDDQGTRILVLNEANGSEIAAWAVPPLYYMLAQKLDPSLPLHAAVLAGDRLLFVPKTVILGQ